MKYKTAPIAVFDTPLGFTTDAIITDFDGTVFGLDNSTTPVATSAPVRAYVQRDVALTQVNAQANIAALGGGTNDCTGRVWSVVAPVQVVVGGAFTASGDGTLWTPASGKKFLLQKYYIQILQNAAMAGGGTLTVTFKDGTVTIPGIGFQCFVPAISVVAGLVVAGAGTGIIEFDIGKLSATANNVLKVNLSGTLTAGNVGVQAWGLEVS